MHFKFNEEGRSLTSLSSIIHSLPLLPSLPFPPSPLAHFHSPTTEEEGLEVKYTDTLPYCMESAYELLIAEGATHSADYHEARNDFDYAETPWEEHVDGDLYRDVMFKTYGPMNSCAHFLEAQRCVKHHDRVSLESRELFSNAPLTDCFTVFMR